MKFKKIIPFLLCILYLTVVKSQELPPIEVFMPENYGAEDQNWGISQDSDNTIYFANNKGLLTYNGAKWKLYESPNGSIVRSVNVIDDKIYTGCYMEFGYWQRDEFGGLYYTSLSSSKGLQLIEDEEFWNILELDRWIIFQSLDRIYIYDTSNQTFNTIDSKTRITKIYEVDDSIYFQKMGQGIYKFENGQANLVTDHPYTKDKIVVNIFMDKGQLLIQTKEDGFFNVQENNRLLPWNTDLNRRLQKFSVYNSIQLRNGNYILGTVSNGMIHIDSDQKTIYEINQSMGLGNNTVLSLFEDVTGNVWLGLDHGINNINYNTSYRVYKDDLGVLGSVYTTFIKDNILYLGTNQGLFYKDHHKHGTFNFVEGTEGQVWTIQQFKNTIFCGHDNGTFVIKNGKAIQISDTEGTWKIQEIQGSPNLLIQGNYNGLSILERKGSSWTLRNKLKGFDISSRFFEFVNPRELLVNHEHKGVYKLRIDSNLETVLSYEKTEIEKGIKSGLTSYNGKVVYGSRQGIFYFDRTTNTFRKDSILSQLYDSTSYVSGKLIESNGKLFAFSKENIAYAERSKLSASYDISFIPLTNRLRETKDGYENLLFIGNNQYLIGTTDGYTISNLGKKYQTNPQITLDAVSVHRINGPFTSLSLGDKPTVMHDENHFQFSFNISDYNKYLSSLYQFRLVGFNDSWSEWSPRSEAYFENLPHGSYTFEARAKLGDIYSSNTVQYAFEIDKPWYLQSFAVVIYIFCGILIVFVTHMVYRSYYKNQRQKLLRQKEKELEIQQLENKQQLMHFKNLDLQKDIDIKNRELGLSTMNLIRRNELLSTIKKELNSVKSADEITNVVKLINRNLNASDDWKLFEEAFENADKDFIKKLKSSHPNLTSNDLRLCTYLRLNLSSKEIAPLLNISLRSVEVKRYRLRKKMNLPHEASLTNYILEL